MLVALKPCEEESQTMEMEQSKNRFCVKNQITDYAWLGNAEGEEREIMQMLRQWGKTNLVPLRERKPFMWGLLRQV